jgi:hypothetical protein
MVSESRTLRSFFLGYIASFFKIEVTLGFWNPEADAFNSTFTTAYFKLVFGLLRKGVLVKVKLSL